jgi:hypothetical protein
VLEFLASLPRIDAGSVEAHAPVLIVPRIFEAELCAELVRFYDRDGGKPSGFMRQVEGVTRLAFDPGHKIRRDVIIPSGALLNAVLLGIRARLVPQIGRAFQFGVTRVERHLVACYDAAERGHFRAHRDNTTRGTAHRRFAVTINLNAGEYDGGALRFPEFGTAVYVPPTGGALVFSCSLLHEVKPVTRGRRYAYLPFLYDDAAAAIREQNKQYVDLRG